MTAEYIECPLDTLPADAVPGGADRRYSYGSDVFGKSGQWIIVENGSTPIRIWKMPPAITRVMNSIFDDRFRQGQDDVRHDIKAALGLD